MVLLVQRDGLLAVAGFGDHFHVRLLIDHRREAVADHGVVIRQDDRDLSLHDSNHYGLRLDSLTLTRVPAPG